ncbi:hypothetical protein J1N35_024197 [Gossypium stocksii]|uniref:Uncharacterized protein n=1 Tax=Gossypium stocksii TaxID=47602 RepID=A0A9D3VKM2_9ROSI|nr:hypothetical protein J1N35_024197 [Gossypium stocksii]
MDLQQLQNDTPLERYNAEKNRYQENWYIGESSTSQQQPEPEMKEEHHFPEESSYSRSVLERIETLMDRIDRRKIAVSVIIEFSNSYSIRIYCYLLYIHVEGKKISH